MHDDSRNVPQSEQGVKCHTAHLGGKASAVVLHNIFTHMNERKDFMVIQCYNVHLANGPTITTGEDYEIPFENGFVSKFIAADENEVLTIRSAHSIDTEYYVPKKSILFISTGNVLTT